MRDTVSPPQWQWEYRYGAGGERESKLHTVSPLDDHSTLSHLWTYYLLSGSKQQLAVYNGRETSETDGCSNTDHRVHFYATEYLTYGAGSSALITTRPNQFREYKIVDHLGSTRVVLDSNGAILSTYDYEPFGKPLVKTGLDSRKSFIDREKDRESGLGNYGVRSFDDARFTTPDIQWERGRDISPYTYSHNNPLTRVDNDGKWDVDVHFYHDRSQTPYGVLNVRNNKGEVVYSMVVRGKGSTNALDRTKDNADTPTGTYDIDDKDPWISGGNRKSYGPNHRLSLMGISGEIIATGRTLIRVHGGQQETEVNGEWVAVKNPKLKNTNGCMRAYEKDIIKLKKITDELQKNNPDEKPGKLTVEDDVKDPNAQQDNSDGIQP